MKARLSRALATLERLGRGRAGLLRLFALVVVLLGSVVFQGLQVDDYWHRGFFRGDALWAHGEQPFWKMFSFFEGTSSRVNSDGTLSINAAAGFEFSFAEDTSGALAVLGVNTYFTGTNATNIGVRQDLLDRPSLLNAGRTIGGTPNDNGVATAIATIQDQANEALGGSTIRGSWQDSVQSIGLRTSAASARAESTQLVRESLEAQRSAISGVSVDEESINLLTFQRQYQGAARFISVVDELTQTLIGLI